MRVAVRSALVVGILAANMVVPPWEVRELASWTPQLRIGSLLPAEGATVGVAHPVVITFDNAVVNRFATEQVMRTLSYFDGMHLARRADAPGLFSVALMDMICPPSTVYAAFNRWGELRGEVAKRIEVYPFNGHEGGQNYQWAHQRAWVREHLGS